MGKGRYWSEKMGTRSNFYKNPSYTYNKHLNLNSALQNLSAYNLATGNLPPPPSPAQPPPAVADDNRKRRRHKRSPPPDKKVAKYDDDQPMSHRDYIHKMRSHFCDMFVFFSYYFLNLTAFCVCVCVFYVWYICCGQEGSWFESLYWGITGKCVGNY